VKNVYCRSNCFISGTLLRMRWYQSFPLQLKKQDDSWYIEYEEEKIQTILVWMFQWGSFLCSPIPQLLQLNKILRPLWSWPKPSKLWPEIFSYEPLSRTNITKQHLLRSHPLEWVQFDPIPLSKAIMFKSWGIPNQNRERKRENKHAKQKRPR